MLWNPNDGAKIDIDPENSTLNPEGDKNSSTFKRGTIHGDLNLGCHSLLL